MWFHLIVLLFTSRFKATDHYKLSRDGKCPTGFAPVISESDCKSLGGKSMSGRKISRFSQSSCSRSWTPPNTCFVYTGNSQSYFVNKNCGQKPRYSDHNLVCKPKEYKLSRSGKCPLGFKPVTSESECKSMSGKSVSSRKVKSFNHSSCHSHWTPYKTCFVYTGNNMAYFVNRKCGQRPRYSDHNLVCARSQGSSGGGLQSQIERLKTEMHRTQNKLTKQYESEKKNHGKTKQALKAEKNAHSKSKESLRDVRNRYSRKSIQAKNSDKKARDEKKRHSQTRKMLKKLKEQQKKYATDSRASKTTIRKLIDEKKHIQKEMERMKENLKSLKGNECGEKSTRTSTGENDKALTRPLDKEVERAKQIAEKIDKFEMMRMKRPNAKTRDTKGDAKADNEDTTKQSDDTKSAADEGIDFYLPDDKGVDFYLPEKKEDTPCNHFTIVGCKDVFRRCMVHDGKCVPRTIPKKPNCVT